jgi:hypothetical protein
MIEHHKGAVIDRDAAGSQSIVIMRTEYLGFVARKGYEYFAAC